MGQGGGQGGARRRGRTPWPSCRSCCSPRAQRSLLVVLQAMDAGGKDGVLRDVLTGLNPAGVRVTSFGVPSEEELAHDFLWRVHRHTPADGPDRRVQPQPLRGRARRARQGAGAGGGVAQALRAHPPVRADARRRGHDDRQAVPAHLRRGAARAPAGPHRQPRRALEVPPRRSRRPQAVAGVHERRTATRWRARRRRRAPWYVVPARPQVGPQPDASPGSCATPSSGSTRSTRQPEPASRASSSPDAEPAAAAGLYSSSSVRGDPDHVGGGRRVRRRTDPTRSCSPAAPT